MRRDCRERIEFWLIAYKLVLDTFFKLFERNLSRVWFVRKGYFELFALLSQQHFASGAGIVGCGWRMSLDQKCLGLI